MKKFSIILAIVLIGLIAARAGAVDTYWQVDTAGWSDPGSWNDGEPGSDDHAYINNEGTAQITQAGEQCGRLDLGEGAGQSGSVTLSGDGQLSADGVFVGYNGTGAFTQTGGTVSSDLSIGDESPSAIGTYELSGTGQLWANYETVGYDGTGYFTQTGGTHSVSSELCLGKELGSNGTYTISAGSLSAANAYVGYAGNGTLNINGSAASITVSNLLHFGADSTFTSVAGSTIHMTGSAFENENTEPTDLAGLSSLELIFEGGSGDIDPFELAGAIDGGFVDNFALGTLTLGDVDIGQIQLVDDYDNGNRGATGKECLFLHDIDINVGSTLDVYSHLLYVESNVESLLDSWIGDGRLFDSTGYLDAVYFSADNWTAVVMVGDVNLDGFVSGTDLSIIISNWGQSLGREFGDLNGNGVVDGSDYTEVLSYWNPPSEPPAEPTPEPATLLLLAFGTLLLNRRP